MYEIGSGIRVYFENKKEFRNVVFFPDNTYTYYPNIYLPKYYDPAISASLQKLSNSCSLLSIGEMVEQGILELTTGDEIGKMAYGTGSIPFVRTSDFSNWEIKADTKQGVSEDIYQQYYETHRDGSKLLKKCPRPE